MRPPLAAGVVPVVMDVALPCRGQPLSVQVITTLSVQADHKWNRNGLHSSTGMFCKKCSSAHDSRATERPRENSERREASQDFGVQHEDLMRAEPPFLRIRGAAGRPLRKPASVEAVGNATPVDLARGS